MVNSVQTIVGSSRSSRSSWLSNSARMSNRNWNSFHVRLQKIAQHVDVGSSYAIKWITHTSLVGILEIFKSTISDSSFASSWVRLVNLKTSDF